MRIEDANVQLITTSIQALSSSVEGLRKDVMSLPSMWRADLSTHVDECQARGAMPHMMERQGEITGVINLVKERQEKHSLSPKSRVPWWAPVLLKYVVPSMLGGGLLGALGFQCSISKASEVDTSRAQPFVATSDLND